MALSKPVIATRGGGTNEIVEDNVTGFLISPSALKELTEKTVELLTDSDLSLRMGLAGRKRVQDFFTVERMAGDYISRISKLNKIIGKSI